LNLPPAIDKIKEMPSDTGKTKVVKEKSRCLPGRREFQLLEILWQHHPLTVTQIRRFLPPAAPLAYTTVMTIMDQLHRKGLVSRQKAGRAFRYEPAAGSGEVRTALLEAFLADFFHSDTGQLVALLPAVPDSDPSRAASPPTSSPRASFAEIDDSADGMESPLEEEDYLL
jgi:predicted transcriptional regulator